VIKVTGIIRPHKLEQVKTAVAALGVTGLNVADVRGTGNAPEGEKWLAGERHIIPFPLRAKIEVVAQDDLKDAIVRAILEHARTGEPGDGKIMVERVSEAIRIRTGERGESAV